MARRLGPSLRRQAGSRAGGPAGRGETLLDHLRDEAGVRRAQKDAAAWDAEAAGATGRRAKDARHRARAARRRVVRARAQWLLATRSADAPLLRLDAWLNE